MILPRHRLCRGKRDNLFSIPNTPPDNDVYALFPTNLAKGMTLVFGEHSVRMTPAGKGPAVSAGSGETNTN